jgi:uncharacterized protein YjbJ (UPF0337 family)
MQRKLQTINWEIVMNKELLENKWAEVRENLKERWANLTDEDIRQINGRYDQLVAKLQQRNGYTKEEAEEEIRNFTLSRTPKTYGSIDKPYTSSSTEKMSSYGTDRSSMRTERTDQWSWLKWLLALGIPLILLGTYFANSKSEQIFQPTTGTAVQTTTTTNSTVDQILSQNIRQALVNQRLITPTGSAISFEAMNGNVTLRGNVATPADKEAIGKAVGNIAGVRSVNNLIEIRQ